MRNLSDIVSAYQSAPSGELSCRSRLSGFLKWFEIRKSLTDAIESAALRNHPHQNCLAWADRRQVAANLNAQQAQLQSHTSFDQVYETVKACVRPPYKHANLLIYDLSLRIAAYKKIYPINVYLHRGSLEGAKLVLNKRALPDLISPVLLPHEFSILKAHEIEDCLCIYKPEIEILRKTGLYRE